MSEDRGISAVGGGGREEGVYWEQGTVCGQGTYRMQGANIVDGVGVGIQGANVVNRGGGGGGGGGVVLWGCRGPRGRVV